MYPSQIFDPRAIVDALVAERCTALHGVPTHFLGVLAEVRARREAGENMDMSTLRYRPSERHVLDRGLGALTVSCAQDRHCSRDVYTNRAHEAAHCGPELDRAYGCLWDE